MSEVLGRRLAEEVVIVLGIKGALDIHQVGGRDKSVPGRRTGMCKGTLRVDKAWSVQRIALCSSRVGVTGWGAGAV